MDRSRLYYQDAYRKSFSATVVSCVPGKKKGTWLTVLDETCFYPEGGGQPWDTGRISGIPVTEVHEVQGKVFHTMTAPLEPGSQVEGEIDWNRRFDHMQQHTGEHILSGLIHRNFGYDNVGFHLGSQEVTIDFNGVLDQEQLERMEDMANEILYENIPVEVTYPQEDQLRSLDYRSKKELTGLVRIVSIPGADVCACCGTHVKSTGEVGIIKVTGMIHYKGGVRIWMLCGRRALLDARKKQESVTRISNLLSAKPELVSQAVEKLKEENQQKEVQISQLSRRLIQLKAASYEKSSLPLAVFEEGLNSIGLRQLCTILYEEKKGSPVLVCAPAAKGGYHYALGSFDMDMRRLSRNMNGRLQGKGGGSAQMAQGTFMEKEGRIKEVFIEEVQNNLEELVHGA